MIVPAFIGTFMGEVTSATGIFFCCTCLLATGFGLNAYGERTPLNLRQASILVILSFVILSLFGTIPYVYVNPFGNDTEPFPLFINSFFESVSGFTTTGLSILILFLKIYQVVLYSTGPILYEMLVFRSLPFHGIILS